jgi:hypothetical protein
MNIDQEQTSSETGTENSETETQTSTETQSTDQSSSTIEGDDSVNLGEGDDTEIETETDDKGEASEFIGAPAEGEAYVIEGLPEGMAIDEEALAAVDPVAREIGLSSKGMSKIAGVYAEKVLPHVVEQTIARANEELQARVLETRKEWEGDSLKAIKGEVELKTGTGEPITFDGLAVKQVKQVAARGIDRVMPAGFRKFLEETGLGQHPAMVAGMYAVGKLVGEDSDFEGGGGTPKPKSREEKYYG